MRAHGFMPISGQLSDTASAIRRTAFRICCRRIDCVQARMDNWPVIIVELSWKKEGTGKSVIFGAMVAVMLVRRDRIAAEAVIFCDIWVKAVMVSEQNRFSITPQKKLCTMMAVKPRRSTTSRPTTRRRPLSSTTERTTAKPSGAGLPASSNGVLKEYVRL